MQMLNSILLTVQVISSLLVIVLVLLQQGKGADMGAAFGAGSAGSVFGSAGAANFLSRATKWAAIIFFVTTGGLAWVAHHPSGSPIDSGIMQNFTSDSVMDTAPSGTPAPAAGGDLSVPSVPSSSAPDAAASSSDGSAQDAAPAAGSDTAGTASPSAAQSDASVPQLSPAAPEQSGKPEGAEQ